ncbi:hypothetical protein BJ973_005626 [Actinoplanes tereljensis]|nr:hypothetical protein [Actinoplanes tereljensis]
MLLRLRAAALAAVMTLGGAVAMATPAEAAACRESSSIPQTSYFVLRSSDGKHTLHLQKGIQNSREFIRVWLDSRYVGAEFMPATLLAGQLAAIFRTRTTSEIWMGKTRQVTKSVAVVQLCGTAWVPVVFS